MKLVIIEDHQLIRDMLAAYCRGAVAGATEVAAASTGAEGLAACRAHQPELIFLDLDLPDVDGLDLVAQLLAASPASHIIALTSFTDEFTVHRALRAPIRGFIAKTEQPLEMLKEAIDAVLGGGRYFSPAMQKLQRALRANPTSFDKLLSDREQRLLTLFGEGLSNEDIGERLQLSAATVKAHRRNILRKLNIHSTPELMAYALEKGFTRVRRRGA